MQETSSHIKVAIIQFNAGADKELNLVAIKNLLEQAVQEKPNLICLPEVFNLRASKEISLYEAEEIATGQSTKLLRDFAKQHQVCISNGSIFEKVNGQLPFNSSILIDSAGEIVAHYKKNYLFKVKLKDKEIDESAKSQAGTDSSLASLVLNNNKINIGLSICYDLRFPELYRQYAKHAAEILLVPSSFSKKTGLAHWQALLQARAIENQAYVIAANQWGVVDGFETYGNSMIVDPWGKVIAQAQPEQNQILSATLDLNYLQEIRQSLPALADMK